MILPRSTKLNHKLGGALSTPLLVPSFSSKGLGFIPISEKFGFGKSSEQKEVSEVNEIIATASQVITDTMLISAFDVAQSFIPRPEKLAINAELTFVDSGGYETSNYYDFSDLYKAPPYLIDSDKWNQQEHKKVLESWPKHLPSVFVSFDQNVHFENQIEDAQKLAAMFPSQFSNFLIKPEKPENKMIPTKSIDPHISELRHFDIIGITEKELGHSMIKRMENLAGFRISLDKAGITAPIHVFGSLDPVATCLYFLSGAEIFDGLTWLRLSYWNGVASYHQNHGAIQIGIHESDDRIKAKALFDNLYYLQDLQSRMLEFTVSMDFSLFPHHSEFFEKSYNTLQSKLK